MSQDSHIARDSALPSAVLLTPPGRGAVATIVVDGDRATAAVSRWFRPAAASPLERFRVGRVIFGRWQMGPAFGEQVVVCRRAVDRVEVNCHGGPAAADAILKGLEQSGCRIIDWREWLIQSEVDPIAAQARIALADAATLRTAAILMDQYRGALRRAVADIVAAVDGGNLQSAQHELDRLVRQSIIGLRLTRPWRVVLAGPVNVGKSSLINAILGFQRSIVFDQPGTTRDVVTASTALDGWPVELADTAGLRDGGDAVEAQGVALAQKQLAAADLVVLVFDVSRPWTRECDGLIESAAQALLVHNKCDIGAPCESTPPGIRTSAVTGAGVAALIDGISKRLVPDAPQFGTAVPFDEGQVAALLASRKSMEGGQWVRARNELLSMLGLASCPT